MSANIFRGAGGRFGVEDDGGLLYESAFKKKAAQAVVEMENSANPPQSWFETRKRLEQMGFTENDWEKKR